MKPIKKILLIFFALVYLAHVYDRLIFTPPIFVHVAVNQGDAAFEENHGKKGNSFILARRHLPTVKQIEYNKLFPLVIKFKSHNILEYKKITYQSVTSVSSKSVKSKSHSNKAPPSFS